MGVDADDEILQDFLVEAGEILEQLSEQLVELESRPDDMDLLNAIFRGFHTVKGGAGFLQLNELVECCHVSENVFDMLRKGVRQVDAELMDVVLQGLDAINAMFAQVREGSELTPASPELLEALQRLADPTAEPAAPVEAAPAPVAPTPTPAEEQDLTDAEFESMLNAISGDEAPADAASADDEITDAEFESLLDQLHGEGQFKPDALPAGDAAAGDEITDHEFENLLDQLHGKGQFKPDALAGQAQAPTPASGKDDISEDEFEALLDQLHGKGQFNADQVASTPAPADKPAAATPAAAAQPAAAAAPAPTKAAPAKAPAKAPAAIESETTVRVDTARLDEIMNMVGELVLVRNRLVRLGLNSGDEELAKATSSLDVVTGDLQASVMKTRMQPIKKVFGRFPRQIRDMSRMLKKEINLELVGEDTDLDKNLVEARADPLVHLVRNAVDHGIEMPDEREAAGKPRTGKVVLSAEQEGDHILLLITDDGKGMDADVLRAKAVEKGMLDKDAADRLSDAECYNLIFAPGFSTKKEISDVSGRGVGMDVVKTRIAQLNGTVFVDSTPGKGSRIVIKVPLTLAIMPTLMVMLDDQAFAFPLVNVKEIFHLDLSHTNVVDGQEVIIVRDKALPLFYLKRWLVPGYRNAEQEEGHVVIIAIGNQQIGFVVDQLVGQEEVVIKPLGKMLQGTPGLAGASITSDGSIALILDVPGMLKHYARRG